MKVSIKTALQINKSNKDFLIYTIKNNTFDKMIFTNDLYRHRYKFGKKSRFILVDVLKKQTNNLTINL